MLLPIRRLSKSDCYHKMQAGGCTICNGKCKHLSSVQAESSKIGRSKIMQARRSSPTGCLPATVTVMPTRWPLDARGAVGHNRAGETPWPTVTCSPSIRAPPARARSCSMRRGARAPRRRSSCGRSIPMPAGSSTTWRRSGATTVVGAQAHAGQCAPGRRRDRRHRHHQPARNHRAVGPRQRRAAAQRHRLAGPAHGGMVPAHGRQGRRRRARQAHRPADRSLLLRHQARAGCSTTSPAPARRPSAASLPSARSTASCCCG